MTNGGSALWAYGMMQFADGTDNDALAKALLRYCELDTMAMVFIWEFSTTCATVDKLQERYAEHE